MKVIIYGEYPKVISTIETQLLQISIRNDIDFDVIKTKDVVKVKDINRRHNYVLNIFCDIEDFLIEEIRDVSSTAFLICLNMGDMNKNSEKQFCPINLIFESEMFHDEFHDLILSLIQYRSGKTKVFKLEDGQKKELALSDIHFVKPSYRQKYCEVFLYDTSYIVMGTLREFSMLPNFVQTARDTVVNRIKVNTTHKLSRTSCYINTNLKDPTVQKRCVLSRNYKNNL